MPDWVQAATQNGSRFQPWKKQVGSDNDPNFNTVNDMVKVGPDFSPSSGLNA
jgi:hypothetical protein